jgi:hypothetical protein
MSQGFLAVEPVTGSRAFGSLYSILRTNFAALDSAHSGTSWPANPVGGKLCWRTDYSPRRLYIYNDLGSTWDEVALASSGLGLELVNARGALASLDQRLDVSTNEDGTLKAATSLNPSQWYVMPNTSTVLNTTTFKLTGADGTAVYHPTRRLKINRSSGGVAFTEVVSSSYSAPDTTVVVRDAVISNLVSVEHSIVAPRKASGGDGAVSYEMIASRGTTSGGGNLNIGDSVVFANGTGTTTLQTVGNYGAGRPIFLVNIHATQSHTFAAYSGQTINGASSITVGPGQSVIIFNNGSTWYRFDSPISLTNPAIAAAVLSGTFTGTYTLGGTPTIPVEAWTSFTPTNPGWSVTTQCSYMKDPMGFVHLKGYINCNTPSSYTIIYNNLTSGYRPVQTSYFIVGRNSSSGVSSIGITTGGIISVGAMSNVYTEVSLDGIIFKAEN